MRVEVYYNLHKHVFSVRHKGRVIAWTNVVAIENPEYVVRQSGRQRVLKEGRKNVHAFVRGDMLDHNNINHDFITYNLSLVGDRVTYNPYKYKSFVYKDSEKPIHRSEWALLAKSDDSPPQIFSYK